MILNTQWSLFLQEELESNTYLSLDTFLLQEYKTKTIFPKYNDIFRAFNLLAPSEVKVVIIGQDPYHGKDQANGLAFSVYDKCKIPPSLRNIFKELVDDTDCPEPKNGNLEYWVYNGILLMNSVLSVQSSKPHSHKNQGWEFITDSVIKRLSLKFDSLVFILWGIPSQKKALFIDETKHLILKAPHPSPLSSYRGFFGSKPFTKTNKYLEEHGKDTIDWCLNN